MSAATPEPKETLVESTRPSTQRRLAVCNAAMRTLLAVLLLSLASACASLPSPTAAEMLAVCRAQEAAWNRGDPEAFMAEGYWRSPELSFFSGTSDTRGFEPMLARYRERYQSGGREMGKLSFSELESVPLGLDAGFVRGRWQVTFPDGTVSAGLFTLAMRRMYDGWRIVHDHTS
jgi:beta-aspartyl-peptidase (threonine type)